MTGRSTPGTLTAAYIGFTLWNAFVALLDEWYSIR